jgi:hypothetical protein
MRTPRDQGLFFTVFFSISLALILFVWILLPAHVKIGEEEEGDEAAPKKVLTREDKILQVEAELGRADEILTRLEKTKDKKDEKTLKKPGKKGPEKKVSAKTK